jgi:lysozyme
MTHSGLERLKKDEGCKLSPYRCTAGKLTIGYGWNLDDVPIPQHIADALLVHAVAQAENDVARLVEQDALSRPRWDVLVNMRFQLGAGGFRGFKKVLAAVEQGSYRIAAQEMMNSRWAEQTPNRARRLARTMERGS